MKNMRISTAELARICNVSQGTVDRALHGRSEIKAETKQKILDVAAQYGYRDFVGEESQEIIGQIGVIVCDLCNEYFPELITEIEYLLRKDGYATTLMMTHYNPKYEIDCIRTMYNMGVKGIIMCCVNFSPEFGNYLKLFDIPIVAIGYDPGFLPYVGIDNFRAMQDMTAYALEYSPENVIYFSPGLKRSDAYAQKTRYEGFLSMIGDMRYSVVKDIDDIKKEYDEKTIIICSNDEQAIEVYLKGVNAKVVGFDNIRAIEEYNLPIDSVWCPCSTIASEAVKIIKNNGGKSVIVEHSIIKHTDN